MELTNLALKLEPPELAKIAEQVWTDYDADEKSRSEWILKHETYIRLYNQMDDSPSPAFEGSSCESLPIITEACNQFQARSYKAIFPSRQFIAATPEMSLSQQEQDRADRIAKHMNYQLTSAIKTYKQDKKAMLLAIAQHGCDFSKTYYDGSKNVVERVRAVDLVLPYGTGPRSMADIERKTHVITMSLNKSKMLAKEGFFLKPLKSLDYVWQGNSYQQVDNELQGISDTQPYGLDKPGCVLEQHRLLDLDGDGIAEPYIVWLDKTAKQVVRIQIRWEVDMNGEATNEKKPIEYFTKFGFLVNPDGVYDLGYGHILAQINIAANKMLRQGIDAGTLANIGNMSGFISDSVGIEGAEIELDLGFFQKIPRSVQDIRNAIYQFQFPGANETMLGMLELMINTGQRIGNTTDAVTGDIQKVVQPMTLMNMLESSLQMPTSIMEQLAVAFEEELEKLYRLNKLYLGGPQPYLDSDDIAYIQPQDYQQPTRIFPLFDPRMITRQQKVAKNQELFQFAMSNPVLQQPQSMEEITRRVLQGMETEDIDAILPKPTPPEDIDDQEKENMYFLMPPNERPKFDVFPEQNHAEHIMRIDGFIHWLTSTKALEGKPEIQSTEPAVDKTIQMVTDEMKKVIITGLMEHRTKHVAYLYGQKEGRHPIGQQGGDAGMGGQPGNANGVDQLIAALSAGQGMGGGGMGPNMPPQGPEGSAGLPPELTQMNGVLGLPLDVNPH